MRINNLNVSTFSGIINFVNIITCIYIDFNHMTYWLKDFISYGYLNFDDNDLWKLELQL